MVQLGNILANQQNDYIYELAPRGKAANRESQQTKEKQIKTNHKLDKYYQGKVIRIDQNEKVEVIRARYNRSCAVTKSGRVYIWGLGFKLQMLREPTVLFQDELGISDIKFGLRHGVYIQNQTKKVYSWGESTFGQTGNNYQETFHHRDHLSSNKYDKPSFHAQSMGSGLTSPKHQTEMFHSINQDSTGKEALINSNQVFSSI